MVTGVPTQAEAQRQVVGAGDAHYTHRFQSRSESLTGVTNPRPEPTHGRRCLRNTTNSFRTPWTNHNQVCTTMNREPALLPCTSYHTRIMHGEGVGTADSTTTTLDTKADSNNSYPSKDPE